MGKRHLLRVAYKILGVYYLVGGVGRAVGGVCCLIYATNELESFKFYSYQQLTSGIVEVVAGLILVLATDRLTRGRRADPAGARSGRLGDAAGRLLLRAGMKVTGVYYIVGGFSSIGFIAGRLAENKKIDWFLIGSITTSIIQIAAGLVLVLVADRITQVRRPDSAQVAGLNGPTPEIGNEDQK